MRMCEIMLTVPWVHWKSQSICLSVNLSSINHLSSKSHLWSCQRFHLYEILTNVVGALSHRLSVQMQEEGKESCQSNMDPVFHLLVTMVWAVAFLNPFPSLWTETSETASQHWNFIPYIIYRLWWLQTLPNPKHWYQRRDVVAVTKPGSMDLKPWRLFVREILKSLKVCSLQKFENASDATILNEGSEWELRRLAWTIKTVYGRRWEQESGVNIIHIFILHPGKEFIYIVFMPLDFVSGWI